MVIIRCFVFGVGVIWLACQGMEEVLDEYMSVSGFITVRFTRSLRYRSFQMYQYFLKAINGGNFSPHSVVQAGDEVTLQVP